MNAGKNRCQTPISQKGFTYLAMLIAVAVGGGMLAGVGELTSHAQLRAKEAELLFAGHQYRQAIAAYYERAPGGAKRYPQKLEDMLEDKRHPMPQRYLRKLYRDPVTGKSEWGLIEAPEGGIMGVHSLSEAHPVKSGGFSKADESFNDAKRYADWKFFHVRADSAGSSPPGAAPPEGSMPPGGGAPRNNPPGPSAAR